MDSSLSHDALLALPRLAIDRGLTARLAISGGSMLPLLREPMTIEVEPLRRRARVGEILVFRAGASYVAHRVIRRRDAGYVTAGDAHPDLLERVAAADVLGRVRAVWSDATPHARRIDTAARRLRGLLLVRARPARLLVRAVARRLRRLRPS